MSVFLRTRDYLGFGIICLLVLLLHCELLSPAAPGYSERVAVSASISIAHGGFSAVSLTKIVLEITHSDIDTIRKEYSYQEGGVRAQLEVPAGKSLTFTARAYQDTLCVLSGSTVFKPKAGERATVHLTLDFLVAAVIITPTDSTVSVGNEFTTYLRARNVTGLGTIGLRVVFDTSKVQVVDLGREDDFLKSNTGSVNQVSFTKDNDNGTVDVVLGVFPASAAVSGDGVIAKIVFKATASGSTDLTLLTDNSLDPDLGLYNYAADLIYSIGLGSRITIQ